MNHTELLNHLVSKHNLSSYLEIGVQNPANNFNKIKCSYKIGVDPCLPINPNLIYSGTSDDYFLMKSDDKTFDLIFIDGLHHSDQVERDFNNSLRCLNDGGFIVLHDCLPNEEIESCVPRGNQKRWMGDVYKFIFKLNTYDGIDFITYSFDCGCCVVWKDATKKGQPLTDVIDWQFYQRNKNMLRIEHNI